MTVSISRAVKFALAGLAGVSLLWSVPGAAQFSKSYKFLESVRKKEGQEVTDALDQGGPTLINTRDLTTGDSALHIVTGRRDLTWMQFLVGKGANVNIRNTSGVTPLVVACSLNFVEGVDFLVSKGAKVDESNNAGETPLITAVHNRNSEMVKVLLKAGANPKRSDNSGRSALDYAKLENSAGLVTLIETAIKEQAAKALTKGSYGPKL